ncbi:MAG: hypothetical protein ACHP6H_05725, partial [Legionellales bacterium]
MIDPYSELHDRLETVLHLESMNEGTYRFSPVQNLKDALDQYDIQKDQLNFIVLVKAIGAMQPYMKQPVRFDEIQLLVNELAIQQGIGTINWKKILKEQPTSPRFQFGDNSTNEYDLIPWLSAITNKECGSLR